MRTRRSIELQYAESGYDIPVEVELLLDIRGEQYPDSEIVTPVLDPTFVHHTEPKVSFTEPSTWSSEEYKTLAEWIRTIVAGAMAKPSNDPPLWWEREKRNIVTEVLKTTNESLTGIIREEAGNAVHRTMSQAFND